MLQHITPAILKEVIRLRREAHEADRRRDTGRPCELTTERTVFRDFLTGLSYDALVELQALYSLGLPRTTRLTLKRSLQQWLDSSRSNDDYIVEYLDSKNIHLAEALERSVELLGWKDLEQTTVVPQMHATAGRPA